jgi:dienelactone hydrolase
MEASINELFMSRRRNAVGLCLIARACLICLTSLRAFCQTEKTTVVVQTGQIVNIPCAADSSQSYALYLPMAYSPAKRWPMIYFFDPLGRGGRPLQLCKELAEKYGFVIAGSNNSRNFSGDQSRSVNAIWLDTHARLSLDEHRTYTSGFSGGARVAGSLAAGCPQCQIAGVIAHGAGYPSGRKESKDNLRYFFAVGDRDFNWPEIMTVRREREDKGLPYKVREYSGTHQWAPPEVMENAIEWLTLKAMQAGTLGPDAALVDRLFQQTQAEGADAEKRNEVLAQLSAYRSLVSDFSGLKDVSGSERSLAELKKSAALKNALRLEQDQIAEQYNLESDTSSKLQAFLDGSGADTTALRSSIAQAMGRLKDQASHAKNEAKRLVFKRAFDGIWAEGIETGQQELESRHFEKAEACFRLMSEVRDEPWPALLLAETHASAGTKKQALRDLQEAVRRGLKDPAGIESDGKLQVLKPEADFRRLIEGLKRSQSTSQ